MKKIIFNTVRILIILCACAGFTYASYSLTKSYLGYQSANQAYDEINDMFMQNISDEDEQENGDAAATEQQTISDSDNKEEKEDNKKEDKKPGYKNNEKKWVWDYEAMLEYNPEAVGYIKLNDSRIQYPIVQNLENEYYLNHGSNRAYNGNGAIFVDARIQGGLDSRNTIIYGHDMLDGSMFADLIKFGNAEFCENHQVFDIYVGYRHYRYYVFASFRADARDKDIYKMGLDNDNDYASWISRCMSKSNYKYPIEKPTTADKTILLSTCIDDHDLRFVVALVRGEEVVD